MRELAGKVDLQFVSEIPSLDEIVMETQSPESHLLLIVDDFGPAMYDSDTILNIFIR